MKGKNWYTYCNNNPVNAIDPSGKNSLGEVLESTELAEGLEGSAGNFAEGVGKRLVSKLFDAMWNWVEQFSLDLGADSTLVFGEGEMTITGTTTAQGEFRIMLHLASKIEAPHIQLWLAGVGNVGYEYLSNLLAQ